MEVSQKTENRVRPQAVMKNKMSMSFDAISVNEAFARIAVAAFIAPLNPTIEEISDIVGKMCLTGLSGAMADVPRKEKE